MKAPEDLVEDTIAYLGSPEARASVARDPYWPKWSSPWWRMTLLWELGLAEHIPKPMVEAMTATVDRHYLHFFPTEARQIPPGKDPRLHVLCQCAAGTLHQVLSACGVPVDSALPWLKRLLLDTQLPDGGLNCDEAAYTGSRKSSIVSTVPSLEAVLKAPGTKTDEELAFLDRGAAYLVAHKLVRSSKGEVIDRDWLKPCFPRFYYYDAERGAAFLRDWARLRGHPDPVPALGPLGPAASRRWALADVSLVERGELWERGSAASFPLLEHFRDLSRDKSSGKVQ